MKKMGYKICLLILVILSMEGMIATTDDFSCFENGEDLCQNNGTCLQMESGMKCYCQSHWGGLHCDLMNTMCYNGKFNEVEIRCDCNDGYGGEYCEYKCNCKRGICDEDGECKCDEGYKGEKCEEQICQFPHIYNSSTEDCSSCADGYEGFTCEDIDECSADDNLTCSHNSTCINLQGSYKCQCPIGMTGRHCDVIISTTCDVTDVNSCGTNGNCTNIDDDELDHVCECSRGFYGEKCEEESIICEDHGKCGIDSTCLQSLNSYECECDDGYLGEYCQLMTSCENDVTCLNGGSCELGSDVTSDDVLFTCRCTDGYYGNRCERNGDGLVVGVETNQASTAVITAITCSCVICVVLIGMAVFAYKKKKTTQTYRTQPSAKSSVSVDESSTVVPISINCEQSDAAEVGCENEAFNDSTDEPNISIRKV